MSQKTPQAQKSWPPPGFLLGPNIRKEIQIKVGVFSKAVELCDNSGLVRSLITSQKSRPPSCWQVQVWPRTEELRFVHWWGMVSITEMTLTILAWTQVTIFL